jgi:hypothetical protein
VWGSASGDVSTRFPNLPDNLPRTIEDAITTTLRPGYTYLWIDRYCINQGNKEEKRIQINQMGKIYASAQLVLIAAAGEDPTYGLPGISRPRQGRLPLLFRFGSFSLMNTPWHLSITVHESTWATRAWTFQEGFLSRRRLFFTNDGLLHVCGESSGNDLAQDIEAERFQNRYVNPRCRVHRDRATRRQLHRTLLTSKQVLLTLYPILQVSVGLPRSKVNRPP